MIHVHQVILWTQCSQPLVIIYSLVCFSHQLVFEWVIPENIHTIPRAASWNSEGEGGFLGLEFRRRGGVTQFGIPKAWGGVSALNSVNFQRKDGESSA